MTLSPHLVTAIAIIAPGLVFIVYGRVRAHRHRGALVAEDQPIRGKRGRAGLENQANILFERKAEPVPSFLLRRFTVPQRTYLRQQYAPAITGYMLCAYLIFVAVSVGLLSRNPSYAAANVALRIWSSYVDVLTGAGYLSVIAALLTAMTVVAYLENTKFGGLHAHPAALPQVSFLGTHLLRPGRHSRGYAYDNPCLDAASFLYLRSSLETRLGLASLHRSPQPVAAYHDGARVQYLRGLVVPLAAYAEEGG